MCSCETAERNDCWRECMRRARKEHRCGECRGPIAKGSRYHYGSGVNDHRGFDMRWCVTCDDRLRALQAADGDASCWPPQGDLKSALRECGGEDRAFFARYLAARREIRRQRRPA
jgi:hypothetical protein